MNDRFISANIKCVIMAALAAITTVAAAMVAPFSAQARTGSGTLGVKLVAAAKVGFSSTGKRLKVKRYGEWIAPYRSRIKTCFKKDRRRGLMKPKCVTIKLVEFQ